ncbi:MAG: VirB3 family type IV secretion system protein [Acidobacteriota bacterium]|nr:VirB3 family type IV secretion system protein [Acidobacteriota bacterium]
MMRGQRPWRGHPVLSRPLTILGVERRWFLLSATLAVALWNTINSLLSAGLVFAALYVAGYLAWRQDPDMLAILRASTRFKSRYDPGKWGEPPWCVLIRR